MTLYNVHIYREMRLFFPGIDAASPEDAARIAADKPTDDADYTEDCDGDNLAALVDVVGDGEFTQSVTIDFEPERLRKAVPDLLAALHAVKAALRCHTLWAETMPGHLLTVIDSAMAKAGCEGRPV